MSKLGVRNVDGYNARVAEAKSKGEKLNRTVHTGYDKETGEAIYENEDLNVEAWRAQRRRLQRPRRRSQEQRREAQPHCSYRVRQGDRRGDLRKRGSKCRSLACATSTATTPASPKPRAKARSSTALFIPGTTRRPARRSTKTRS